jgi:lysophospholipase L1-like esterase
VITTTVGVAAVEVYLRLTRAHVNPDTLRARSLEYEATLFSRNAFPQMLQRKNATPSGQVVINPRGYRGQLFGVPKPQGTVRIVMLGGSSLFDMYAREGEDWPHQVQSNLRDRGYRNVEVINAGTPGHATFDLLGRFYSEIWMFEPDYLLVYESWNDIKYFHFLDPQRSLLRAQRPAPVNGNGYGYLVTNPFMYYSGWPDRLLSHSQFYVRLRDRYIQWRIGTPRAEGIVDSSKLRDTYGSHGPRQFALDLHLLVSAARSVGAKPALLTQARLLTPSNTPAEREKIAYEFVNLSHDALLHAFADCDRAIFAVARADNVPVLDLSRMLSGQSELFEDHVHTTAAGSKALARATADFLEPMLRKP